MKEKEIFLELKKIIENPKCELNFNSPYELLVAVILSAQCTDKRVNDVTAKLFLDYNTPYKMVGLSQKELEQKIYSCGFYRNKAKAILECSNQIINEFGGEVPNTLTDLMKLKGVGRKTANVVYSTAFGGCALAVDRHVFRVSKRLGLSKGKNVQIVEKDLMKLYPKEDWSRLHHTLVLFGRYFCKSQNPDCENCKVNHLCKYYSQNESKKLKNETKN